MDWIRSAYVFVAIIAGLVGAALAVKTRRLFTHWRALLASGFSVLLGLSIYFYLPIASMTNPPMNWAYPRTVEGFFHGATRGQYERIHMVDAFDLAGLIGAYSQTTFSDFGLVGILAALIPTYFLLRMRPSERKWIIGLAITYLCLSLFLLVMLNPSTELVYNDILVEFFCPSHLILAVWSGYGLALVGTILARRKIPTL